MALAIRGEKDNYSVPVVDAPGTEWASCQRDVFSSKGRTKQKTQLRIHVPGKAQGHAPAPFINNDPTIGQVIHWHENNASRKIHSAIAEKERRRVWGLLRDALGDWRVADVKAFQGLNFINAQTGLDSDWSRRRWNAIIQRPFNAAAKLQLIERNPFRGLNFPQGKRGRDWTEAEYQQMRCGTTACFSPRGDRTAAQRHMPRRRPGMEGTQRAAGGS